MNQLQVFQNAEFGSVRTVVVEGVPHFIGKDVAEILGYSRSQKAVKDLVDDEDVKTLKYKACPDLGLSLWEGNDFSDKTIINESGLYSLILSSRKPQAKAFKRWVTSEVLPSIRRTGAYQHKPMTLQEKVMIVAQGYEELEKDITRVGDRLYELENSLPLLPIEADELNNSIKQVIVRELGGKHSEAYKDSSIRGKAFADIYAQLKREFDVSSYKAIRRVDRLHAYDLIYDYRLPMSLSDFSYTGNYTQFN